MSKIEVAKLKGGRRNPFLDISKRFSSELHILKELNKELPKSIEQMKKKSRKRFAQRYASLSEESRSEIDKFIESIRDHLIKMGSKQKQDSHAIELSGRPAEVFSELVFGCFLFPSRFNMFIRDMSLVYLVAAFENFLQEILELSFQKKPEILATSQKSVTIEELMKFKDIDQARDQIVEKETSSIVNQSIEDIDKYLEQKFDLKISGLANWEKFKERFYRRNILIHNSGMPNKLYRLKTGYHGKDKRMTVSQSYFSVSIRLFNEMAQKISESLTRKLRRAC